MTMSRCRHFYFMFMNKEIDGTVWKRPACKVFSAMSEARRRDEAEALLMAGLSPSLGSDVCPVELEEGQPWHLCPYYQP